MDKKQQKQLESSLEVLCVLSISLWIYTLFSAVTHLFDYSEGFIKFIVIVWFGFTGYLFHGVIFCRREEQQ